MTSLRSTAALAAAFLALVASFSKPARAADTKSTAAVVVPAEVNGAHFCVTVLINGKPARMVLDTGADQTVVSVEAAARLGLKAADGAVPGSGAAAQFTAAATRIPELSIGGVTQRRQQAYIVPMPAEFAYDGVLGTTFFAEFVVTMDYQRRQFAVSRRQLLSSLTTAQPVPVRVEHGKLLVEATAAGITGWYSVDTGAGNALTFFAPAVERYDLRNTLAPGIRTITGISLGGVTRGDLTRAPMVSIGPHTFRDVVVERSLAEKGFFANPLYVGNLGGELWRRFTVTFDYARGHMYLQPNEAFGQTFVAPRVGFMPSIVEGVVKVVDVLADGPAAQAGVAVGDVLLALNGTPLKVNELAAVRETLDRLHGALQGQPGSTLVLTLSRSSGETRDVTLTLRDLL